VMDFTRHIVYPEGDTQEIFHALQINQLVDINGRPATLPLSTHRVILYRVQKIVNREERKETSSFYYLEQLPLEELLTLVSR